MRIILTWRAEDVSRLGVCNYARLIIDRGSMALGEQQPSSTEPPK